MTKLDIILERAKSLPADRQDALAEQMALWLDEPDWPEPDDQSGTIGMDAELARRVAAWEASPAGVAASELHARLKSRRESP